MLSSEETYHWTWVIDLHFHSKRGFPQIWDWQSRLLIGKDNPASELIKINGNASLKGILVGIDHTEVAELIIGEKTEDEDRLKCANGWLQKVQSMDETTNAGILTKNSHTAGSLGFLCKKIRLLVAGTLGSIIV